MLHYRLVYLSIAGLGNSENLDKGFASGFFHLYNGLHAALF